MGEGRRRWLVLALWVALIGGAAWALIGLIARAGGPDAIVAAAGRVDALHWLVLIPATVAFYGLDWLRFRALLAILGHRLPLRLGLELAAVSYFVTCLTPTAELHLPAMVLWLVQRGYPLGAATAAALAKSIYMLLWVCVTGLIGLALHAGPVVPPSLRVALAIAFVVPAALVLTLALAIVMPARMHGACARALARPSIAGWRRALITGLDDTVAGLAIIGRSRSSSHVAAHLACLAFIACYVAIGWLLAHGVGLTLGPAEAGATFAASLMVAYIAPTPGGAGATESATAFLLDPTLPAAATTVALLLRTLCTYAIAPIGLILVVRQARRMGWTSFRRRLRERPHPVPVADTIEP